MLFEHIFSKKTTTIEVHDSHSSSRQQHPSSRQQHPSSRQPFTTTSKFTTTTISTEFTTTTIQDKVQHLLYFPRVVFAPWPLLLGIFLLLGSSSSSTSKRYGFLGFFVLVVEGLGV